MRPSHYREMRLSIQEGTPTPVLMSQLFEKLHRWITQGGFQGRIAVSFPEMDQTLGQCLRLHGSADDLTALGLDWQGLLKRVVRCSGVFTAPPEATLQVFKRVTPRAGGARWFRRWQRRHGTKMPEQVSAPEVLADPFVQIQSQSTGQPMWLFIARTTPTSGVASPNSYGLGAPVPVF